MMGFDHDQARPALRPRREFVGALSWMRNPERRRALRASIGAMRIARRARAHDGEFRCRCCGGRHFDEVPVLWPELIEAWKLSADEVRYIDRQQGLLCRACGARLRSMALAHAISVRLRSELPLSALALRHPRLRILEINRAGELTQFLQAFPRHVLAEFPDVDIQQLPYQDERFDLVVHSDTLEHVADPRQALHECLRVTRPGGFVAFTVPLVYGRLTRSREGLPASYHGYAGPAEPDLRVVTEFGADVWAQVLAAGAGSCQLVSLEFPAGVAIVAEPTAR
jgi:SAM-dependent methyltransferase